MREKDPFQGLNEHFRAEAKAQYRSPMLVGKVLSLEPLTVRADGLDLKGEDLYMAQHLLPGWAETLSGLSWPVDAELPETVFTGEARVAGQIGTCSVTRPRELVQGKTAAVAKVAHGRAVKPGDLVLMLRSEDGQDYYIVERLVNMDGVAIAADPATDGAEDAPAGPGG